VTIRANAASGMRDVSVTNPDSQPSTLLAAFRLSREFPIPLQSISDEPSIAVDPRNPSHVVIGFNDISAAKCAWAESMDYGGSWRTGYVPLPDTFTKSGDPWVRFGPD